MKSKNKKTIKILSPAYLPKNTKIYGGERAFLEIGKHLQDHHVKISVLSPATLNTDFGFNSIEIKTSNTLSWILGCAIKALKLHKKNYDLVFAYNHFFTNVFPAYIISKILKKPLAIIVYHVEKFQSKSSFKKRFEIAKEFYGFETLSSLKFALIWSITYRILKCAEIIITSSQSTTNDLIALGINKKKIHKIYLGIEHELPKNTNINISKEFDGVYLGRISPNKGIFELLQAWNYVVHEKPEAKLAIVGSGSPEHLGLASEFIKNHKLEKSVELLGFLSEEDVSKVLFSSKLFLFPSHTEGFCFTIAKAILHRLPVITWDIPILREVYGSSLYITFVKEGDIKSFSKEVIKKLDENVNMDGIQSYVSVLLNKYSWDLTAKKFVEVCKNMY